MMFGGIIWNGSGNLANEKEVIVMSWYNPSQDEAAEEYYASKSRYANAANQRASAAKAAGTVLMKSHKHCQQLNFVKMIN